MKKRNAKPDYIEKVNYSVAGFSGNGEVHWVIRVRDIMT
jgi:hypothetical protein